MTPWIPFPCPLEARFYDLELKSGRLIRRIWPLIREGEPDTFFDYENMIVPEWLITRVRYHDSTNTD